MPLKPTFPPVYNPSSVCQQAPPNLLLRSVAPVLAKPAVQRQTIPPARFAPLPALQRTEIAAPASSPKLGSTVFRPVVAQAKTVAPMVIQPVKQIGKPTKKPDPIGLEYKKSKDATTAMMVLLRGYDALVVAERGFMSGGGKHAEEKAIRYLQDQVNNGTLTPQHRGVEDYILFLAVSKSPCSSTYPRTRTDGHLGCQERLEDLMQYGLRRHGTHTRVTFAVQVAASKPYQPKIKGGKKRSIDKYRGFGGGPGNSGAFSFVN